MDTAVNLLPKELMMSRARSEVCLTVVATCFVLIATSLATGNGDAAVAPDRVISLFNGRDLNGWTTWLVDTKRKDPRAVYSVRDGVIRISGDGYGYLSTDRAYRDYRLVVEFKWGEKNWGARKGLARDSGIFLHTAGPDGGSYDCGWRSGRSNTGKDISSGAYKAAIECQVMEGETGGILLIGGRFADGRHAPLQFDARVSRDRKASKYAPPRFDPSGQLETFRKGWVRWSGRDPASRDVFGFRGRDDVESPPDSWTRVECVCAGDRITVSVNGKRVNEVENVFPRAGKILLQCEGSEIFFRKVELHPIAKIAPVAPKIDGDWWQVAGNPDLGKFTSPKQEPVDFGVWQATDGTWQLWSCIRKTNCGGNTRLFHGWEGRKLTDKDWNPLGIVMQADPKLGESPGGLQAPHVIRHEGLYYMFYGDWANICMATSKDGKKFTRVIQKNGKTGIFNEGANEHARDAMLLKVGNKYHCYYTAHSMRSPKKNHRGVSYCRVSSNLRDWGESHVVAEGSKYGKGPYSTECPHVVFHPETKQYFLFNTQRYGKRNHTTVFRSSDPLKFGINDNRLEVTTLPVAAPEIILHEGEYYIASLKPTLDGIHIARLKWVARDQ